MNDQRDLVPNDAETQLESLSLGVIFANYRLIRVLASGGMGVVVEAEHRGLGRLVAIKLPNPRYLKDATRIKWFPDRFLQEARILAQIEHPYVIPVYDCGSVNDCPYYAMKLIRGIDLEHRIDQSGPWLATQVLELGERLGRAIAAIHQAGYINRDIKPANVLFETEQQPRIIDFGLAIPIHQARTTCPSGAIVGSPSFIAPEQIRSETGIDVRVDVFSLGALLFFAVTGRRHIQGSDPMQVLGEVSKLTRPPERTEFPELLDDRLVSIIRRCMEPDPRDRYPTAQEVAEDCACCLAGGEPRRVQPQRVGTKSSESGLRRLTQVFTRRRAESGT